MKNNTIDPVVEEAFQIPSSPKNVLVFAPLAYSTPHFETDLEIAKRQIDIGNNVHFVPCLADLPSCRLNPNHEKSMCERCMSRSIQGMERLLPDIQIHQLGQLDKDQSAALLQIPKVFTSTEELSQFRIENMDAGMAAKSTLIDFIQKQDFAPIQYAELIHRLIQASLIVYFSIQNLIDRLSVKELFIYNGRWSAARGALRAAEAKGIVYYLHERGSSKDQFTIAKNHLLHDISKRGQQANLLWEHNKQHANIETGARFYINQRLGKEKRWYSQVKTQKCNKMPSDWNDYSRRIIFYTSSEFELSSIGNEIQRLYPDQISAIKDLCNTLKEDPEAHVWVRMHPNDKSPQRREFFRENTSSLANVSMLYSNEDYDSYYMLCNSNLVVTEFSTVGAEATFWGIPSISLGKTIYHASGVTYYPQSIEQAHELYLDKDLPPKPKESSLIYGVWRDSFGDYFKHIKTDKISDMSFSTKFLDAPIKPNPISSELVKFGLFPAFVSQRILSVLKNNS